MCEILYTANIQDLNKVKSKSVIYRLIPNQGNDAVTPDIEDLNYYKNQSLTWEGFRLNYLAKLMRSEAIDWMNKVANEAVNNDVVLVDEERVYENSYRKLLVEMILNMFIGELNIKYAGEVNN